MDKNSSSIMQARYPLEVKKEASVNGIYHIYAGFFYAIRVIVESIASRILIPPEWK
jgi:hypothetical protein